MDVRGKSGQAKKIGSAPAGTERASPLRQRPFDTSSVNDTAPIPRKTTGLTCSLFYPYALHEYNVYIYLVSIAYHAWNSCPPKEPFKRQL